MNSSKIRRRPLSSSHRRGSVPKSYFQGILLCVVFFLSVQDVMSWTTSNPPIRAYVGKTCDGDDHLLNWHRSKLPFRISTLHSASSSASNHNTDSSDINSNPIFRIQAARYADLGPVSEIILDSFYAGKVTFQGLVKLAELNRLQQNYPHFQKEQHMMYIAVVKNDDIRGKIDWSPPPASGGETIVGFVDVDMRPCKPEIKLPRPYLSDLCVHPNFRKQGVAYALVRQCQNFVKQQMENSTKEKCLYIRVEEDNIGAVRLYENLGYEQEGDIERTNGEQNILTLVKIL